MSWYAKGGALCVWRGRNQIAGGLVVEFVCERQSQRNERNIKNYKKESQRLESVLANHITKMTLIRQPGTNQKFHL